MRSYRDVANGKGMSVSAVVVLAWVSKRFEVAVSVLGWAVLTAVMRLFRGVLGCVARCVPGESFRCQPPK